MRQTGQDNENKQINILRIFKFENLSYDSSIKLHIKCKLSHGTKVHLHLFLIKQFQLTSNYFILFLLAKESATPF